MRKIIFFCLFIACLFYLPYHAMGNNALKQTNASKWRIIYAEGGDYNEYHSTLLALVKGLMQQNLMENIPVPQQSAFNSGREIWDWIIANTESHILEFVPDGYYSAEWNSEKRIAQKQNILNRIQEKNDIDIILSFGTFSGIDFATDEHAIPTFVMAVSDPISAGISKSYDDSGLNHVHVSLEYAKFEQQLATFYDIFKFKKLGVPFGSSADSKRSIAFNQIENAAKNIGFELELCQFNSLDTKENVVQNLIHCLNELSEESDAIYLTMNTGMQWDKMTQILQPIIKNNIPTFSQLGVQETELGVLLSLSQPSFDNEGINTAIAIAETLNGKLPRECNQVFSGAFGLAVNLKMAVLIGWNPPFEILAAVDNIYHEIKNNTK